MWRLSVGWSQVIINSVVYMAQVRRPFLFLTYVGPNPIICIYKGNRALPCCPTFLLSAEVREDDTSGGRNVAYLLLYIVPPCNIAG
jgi:hypothetical protein